MGAERSLSVTQVSDIAVFNAVVGKVSAAWMLNFRVGEDPVETVDTQPYIWFNQTGILPGFLESAMAASPEPC